MRHSRHSDSTRPLNDVLPGPVTTLHHPNGSQATRSYWYHPFFDKVWNPFVPNKQVWERVQREDRRHQPVQPPGGARPAEERPDHREHVGVDPEREMQDVEPVLGLGEHLLPVLGRAADEHHAGPPGRRADVAVVAVRDRERQRAPHWQHAARGLSDQGIEGDDPVEVAPVDGA